MKEVLRETGAFSQQWMGKERLQSLARLSKRVEQEGGEGFVISQDNKCREGREHRKFQLITRLHNELGCCTAAV